MLVTADPATLMSTPEGGTSVGTVAKNSTVQLIAKRGGHYQVSSQTGAKGWVAVDEVVPAYFFADAETRKDHDPIYNPDKYVYVKNSSWMQLPHQQASNVTVFNFLIQNKSKFDMDNLALLATIKDKNDKVLETKEIRIEGGIPAFDSVMVGTLMPKDRDKTAEPRLLTGALFRKLANEDASLNLRWSEGIEVQLESEGFVEANIDLLQVVARPKGP
jgi:hypothetical protein